MVEEENDIIEDEIIDEVIRKYCKIVNYVYDNTPKDDRWNNETVTLAHSVAHNIMFE